MQNTIKINLWTDVACPGCYVAHNSFEQDDKQIKKEEKKEDIKEIKEENKITDSHNHNTNSPLNNETENEKNEKEKGKEKVKDNLTSNNIKKDNDNDNERNISTAQITGNKMNNKENIAECSNFIVDGDNESKFNIKNNSIKSFDINIELNNEKMKNRKSIQNIINRNGRYSDSLNNSALNNVRRSTVRISDCSENITDASGRKVPFFQANFDSDIHNIEVKPIENNNI